jgi:hypothetical protein
MCASARNAALRKQMIVSVTCVSWFHDVQRLWSRVLLRYSMERLTMKLIKSISAVFLGIVLATALGCAPTPTKEGTGEYVDDTIITTKVKAAIFNEPSLKSSEINVETFKGAVQLSGFVKYQADINKAVQITNSVKGVKSVKNDMRLK